MHISILKEISEFAKENNISMESVYYNFSDFFPLTFYETVVNYLERINHKFSHGKPIDDFIIGFDSNKNAYFEFVGKNSNTRVIVIQDNIKYDIEFPSALIIKENIFLENVMNLDFAKNHKIMESLPLDFIKRFIKEESQVEPIENSLQRMAKQIIDYIKYLENEYELLKKEIEAAKEIEKIYFLESEASTNTPRFRKTKTSTQAERKYDEIPFEERKSILDSYPSLETFEAKSTNTTSKYYVKVYKIKEKCKLVMEPVEGNKYTKVVHLDSNKISKGTIREIVIDSLQLSREETTNTKEITRHSHTTIEEYKNLLEYLLNGNNTGISYSAKNRIDEASEIKTR